MSVLTVTHIVTPVPIPLFTLNTTHLHLRLSNTTLSNTSSTVPLDPMPGHGGVDDDPPPDGPGFPWPAAPRSTTSSFVQTFTAKTDSDLPFPPFTPFLALPAKTATVVVTITPSPESSTSATSGFVLPTEYLSQVPRGWPHTQFGVGRKGEVASWGLTNGQGKTVGVVRHEVRWFPRPLRVGEGEVLEGWRSTFVAPKGGMGSEKTGSTETRGTRGMVVLPTETKRGAV